MRAADHVARIKKLRKSDLIGMLQQLVAGKTLSGWPDGKAFEHLILRAFEIEGAEVTWPFSVRRDGQELEQIDGAVRDDGLSCLVEAKHWAEKVDYTTIAKLRAQLNRRPSQVIGSVFSASGYTAPAKVLAQFTASPNVLLWELDDIEYGLKNRAMRKGLQAKFRHAVEHGFTDYSLLVEAL
ncbi:restriction endonuclease [Corallococcus terminator]|uniref:Restriction endonuclease n=1 Tax=Corallococcus terminator TaxID=2316733 RepID=A0A3A8JUJ5_9BACT|nr:restriction endonuclease [Corallococcus terminator]RKG94091.1 restriction endonuclease [Corallococcus terminator]